MNENRRNVPRGTTLRNARNNQPNSGNFKGGENYSFRKSQQPTKNGKFRGLKKRLGWLRTMGVEQDKINETRYSSLSLPNSLIINLSSLT